MDPLVLEPLVMGPLVLEPCVLGPLVMEPFVLEPLEAAPLAIALVVPVLLVTPPLVVTPLVVTPFGVTPVGEALVVSLTGNSAFRDDAEGAVLVSVVTLDLLFAAVTSLPTFGETAGGRLTDADAITSSGSEAVRHLVATDGAGAGTDCDVVASSSPDVAPASSASSMVPAAVFTQLAAP